MNKYLKSTLAIFIFSFSFSQSDNLIVDKSYTKDIEKLARNTKVKKAFEYIVDIEEKTNRNLIKLTEIEAPPFKEMKRAEEKRETVDVSLVLQRKHAEQLRSIQNRHSVELKLRDQELEEVKQESNRLSAALADALDKLDRRRNFEELVNTSTARDQNFVQPRVHLGAEHQASASTQQGTRRWRP